MNSHQNEKLYFELHAIVSVDMLETCWYRQDGMNMIYTNQVVKHIKHKLDVHCCFTQ